jgi:hypothetical protein
MIGHSPRSGKRQSPAAATRVATLKTWEPKRRRERILKTRAIRYSGNPRELIQAAAALLPSRRPLLVQLRMVIGDQPEGPLEPTLSIAFGVDGRGVSREVGVVLTPEDQPVFLAFLLLRCEARGMGIINAEYPDRGREGEELPVPEIALTEIAAAPQGLIC